MHHLLLNGCQPQLGYKADSLTFYKALVVTNTEAGNRATKWWYNRWWQVIWAVNAQLDINMVGYTGRKTELEASDWSSVYETDGG